MEYSFYFPAQGRFSHFPVHVAKDEKLVASAEPTVLHVVLSPSAQNRQSWAWLSQYGEDAQVLAQLEQQNLERLASVNRDGSIPLEQIAWRMKERRFYDPCIALLKRLHIYNDVLYSYAVYHNDLLNLREFLKYQDRFLDECGLSLNSTLLTIDPVERQRHQHLEYAPLVNARTHRLGARRTILNHRLAAQYTQLLTLLRYRATLSDSNKLAVTYYLLLQDRIDEALELFADVDSKNLEAQLQFDSLKVYTDFCMDRPEKAHQVAIQHQEEPWDRWRNLFRNALSQLAEMAGAQAQVVDDKNREQRQSSSATSEPDFDFAVDKKTVTLNVRNLSLLHLNFYRMDIELLFSRQPFVQQQSSQFAFIKPNRSTFVQIPSGQSQVSFDLPAEFHGANVVVEVVAAGRRKAQICYAHDLLVNLSENYGHLRVAQKRSGHPLSKTYIKVYARMKSGEVKFYKDGYTDLRGMFDYASLNTSELAHVERFAVLILSDVAGAVIQEAETPKR